MDLFQNSDKQNFLQIPVEHGILIYYPGFIDASPSGRLMQRLQQEINWKQETIRIFGKSYLTPRLTSWYGDEGKSYSYSGLKLPPNSWTGSLLEIKSLIQDSVKLTFNSVLLNWYRGGNDSMGWHADDEKELGINPEIASMSLGETRTFRFRQKKNHRNSFGLPLENGSLLLMAGEIQQYWQHALPRTQKNSGDRLNLTFRRIVD